MQNAIDYDKAISFLLTHGKINYGQQFSINHSDLPLIRNLLCYFLKDEAEARLRNINLSKGILLVGPIGSGKTSLMSLLRLFEPVKSRFIIKTCRDVSFEFMNSGYDTIHKYSTNSFKNFEPIVYCFDDLGAENNLKFFGNECNVMAEVLLSRYDLFIHRKLLTHLTTNLSASEIEMFYGKRVRSRMRQMFNLFAFDAETRDKRK